jgi:hypothetical protein
MPSKTVAPIRKQSTCWEGVYVPTSLEIKTALKNGRLGHPRRRTRVARGQLDTWAGTVDHLRATMTPGERRQRLKEIRRTLRLRGLTYTERWIAHTCLQLLQAATAPAVQP